MARRLWTQIFLLAICLAAVLYARYHLQSRGAIDLDMGDGRDSSGTPQ